MHNPINTKRPIRFSEDGLTVFVTLKCGSSVMIDRDDFDRLVTEGLSLNWSLSGDGHGNYYVCLAHPRLRNIVPVAREIMRAGRGQVIRYRSRDRLDLRKPNLLRCQGPAKRSLRG
ncbi:hypothetical protein [Rhizobium sp. SL42]|uniref:hypothetical protein n=1 Tax=Rhizobium sp. SL42 TaxID=2806346 RepID=UPI001F481C15|nr:hypothetical protein [Rhizobium sp. SL42]UJW75797.1 hypothetical protein IM739_04675 [Rhizobium sp. SL42]